MNKLEITLQRDLDDLGRLKRDLVNLEELLEDKPLDQTKILDSMAVREKQMEQLN